MLTDESQRHMNEIFKRLGVLLIDDDVRPESFYNPKLADVIVELERAGELTHSEGAKVVFLDGFSDREGNQLPMIVQKSDGGYLYATTDLAALRFRVDELHADWIIYVVDARQSQHLSMLFQASREAGFVNAHRVRLDHVAFGTILGKDRTPFKTREGETVKLADVLDEAEQRALAGRA